MRGTRRVGALVLAAVAVTGAIAGCGSTTADGGAANDTRLVAEVGTRTVEPADRHQAVELSGTTLTGSTLDVAALRGRVVVVNVWGSWCSPCRAEAPSLAAVAQELSSKPVSFVGVNVRDDNASALGFDRQAGITYPSIVDQSTAKLLAFNGFVSPKAIPSTIVLDRQGRVAAVHSGQVTVTELRGLVEPVLAESAAS